MVPAGNTAKHLSSVNHTTKTIHHYYILYQQSACTYQQKGTSGRLRDQWVYFKVFQKFCYYFIILGIMTYKHSTYMSELIIEWLWHKQITKWESMSQVPLLLAKILILRMVICLIRSLILQTQKQPRGVFYKKVFLKVS